MKLIILYITILFSVNAYSQKDTVTLNVEFPTSMVISNGELYTTEYSLGLGDISKYDLSITNPFPEPFFTDLNRPGNLYIDKKNLYYSAEKNDGFAIYRIDLSQANSQPELIVENPGFYSIRDVLVSEERLFYIRTDYSSPGESTSLMMFDIVTPDAVPVKVVNAPFATDLEIKGDFLYYSESLSHIINRVDLNSSNPSPEVVFRWIYGPVGLAFNGNDLYFNEIEESKFSKIDLSLADPVLSTIDTGYVGGDVEIYEDDIYTIVRAPTSMILRYNNVVTSTDLSLETELELIPYPSPSQELLFLKNWFYS